MTIDILSDLHFDYYFPSSSELSEDAVKSIFDPIFFMNRTRETGNVLIVAGDLGHYNKQNLEGLKIFQKHYYKHIICVLGNHDYYLINPDAQQFYEHDSLNRAKEMRELINSQENMYCLDGNIVEINGVKFGGCDSWYNGSYLIQNKPIFEPTTESINRLWKSISNDSKYIFGVENFDDIYKIELPKIEAIYKECDVMITHINPSVKDKHIALSYRDQPSNTFFTFDAESFMATGNMKYWIFGHTHDRIEYEQYGVQCICNPLGSPQESYYGDDTIIRSIELWCQRRS